MCDFLVSGSGKNIVIIYSLQSDNKYLILVPRIILMEQLKLEILKHKPELKNNIQTIGNNNSTFKQNKNITICVYNSIDKLKNYFNIFHKIFIDEAHHINTPEIYMNLEDRSLSIVDTSYLKIIKDLSKYNNNIYLSATIDKYKDFLYYKKDIRELIKLNYLTDYTIHIPIFNNDPTNTNICKYLLKYYRNIIVYCNTQDEGTQINRIFNSLQLNSSKYIDCNTNTKERNINIELFKNGKIPFLINVKILIEGFDATITKGVCLLHLPSLKTTIIQIIGRSLRLHPLKKFANIILPFSNNDDSKTINKFLNILAQNDYKLKNSFVNKQFGGYINIDKDDIDNNDDENNDILDLKYELIYNSIGYLQNNDEIFNIKLKILFKYCNEFQTHPTFKLIYENINLGYWYNEQKKKIINIECDLYKIFSTNIYIKKELDRFLENKNTKISSNQKIELLFEYCNIYKTYPPQNLEYKNINLGNFFSKQKQQLTNNECNLYKKLSNNEYVKKELDRFLENKKKVKLSEDQRIEILFKYSNTYKTHPIKSIKFEDINLGEFLHSMKKKINNTNDDLYIKLSKNKYIKESLDKYLKNKTIIKLSQKQKIQLLFKYCNNNNKHPCVSENFEDYNIGRWYQDQKKKINNINNDLYIELSKNKIIKENLDKYLNK